MKTATDLRKSFPRRFVPEDADMGSPEVIERLGEALLARTPDSPAALEQWLEDRSEFFSCIREEHNRRYIAMTSQTDDPERERACLHIVQEIEPRVKRLSHRLYQAYLSHPHRRALGERYRLFDRWVENRVALFREENVPLEVQEAELKQQYQKTTGAMTVRYRGVERTLQQMAAFLEEPNRATRQGAWELTVRRRLQDASALEDLYERLHRLRLQIAKNAGFDSYLDYIFLRKERFDYTPEDCLRFHDAVEQHFVPLADRLARARRTHLGVERLRPWDFDVDPLSQPPLRPFESTEEFVDRTKTAFQRVDPELGAQFSFMHDRTLLDLESRKGKAPGGYQSSLEEKRWPFIFMNAVGLDKDVRTLVHEGGHAFNSLAAREEPLIDYRHPPLEFAEVASMGMELLALPHLDAFYDDPADRRRSYRERLEDVIQIFPWIATIDAFQHWLYRHPDHTAAERRAAWVETFLRFDQRADWSGYDEELGYLWHRQLHVFLAPLYYIEYGIAQVGALQVWLRSRTDYNDAVTRYRQALALGGSLPLPELFAAAGARFAFDDDAIGPLAQVLAEELDRTDDA